MNDSSHRQVIVPFTQYEWKYVRQLFRSRRIEDIKECVIILSTWISRTGDNTPVAISCSHVLLQAELAELKMEGMCESERYMAIDDLRSKHGFAIVRFVNYINEMGQTGANLKAMAHAVSKFGIEKKIVDIRHAITHQTCPDLAELRYATKKCLEWLWKNFWVSDSSVAMNSRQATTANSSKSTPSEFNSQRGSEQQHLNAIRAFNKWRLKNRDLKTELEWSEVPEIFVIKKLLLLDAPGFLRCFFRDGHLILAEEQWKKIWKFPPTSSDENWIVPEIYQNFWEPLFHLMFSLKLGPEIIIAFLWRLKEPHMRKHQKDQITAYVRMIVLQFADIDVFSADEWCRVLDHLLPVAKNFNIKLIDTVMRNCPNLSRKRRNQIRQILNISSPVPSPNRPSTSSGASSGGGGDVKYIHTVDDIQALMKLRLAKRTASEASASSTNSNKNETTGIELCEATDWVDVPFGMAPGQRLETFTVVIDDIVDRKRKAFDAAIVLDSDSD
ncbi:hypothetical protein CAEBREN_24567 [Caenorhabditis brenneri]|uniref:Uncharacterized protein n=1 Tax=Caenorhabditis brenneri TaxID=135651 RepID=G0P1Z7_CAEBE|nr:hypothetical protein CAEBREN_24567 [Caenorhabditis brenneri]